MRPRSFIVPGVPVAKGRHRTTKHGTHYTPTKTRQYERTVAKYALAANIKPTVAPIILKVEAYFRPPPSWPAWKKRGAIEGWVRPTFRPDISNIIKAVEDALNCIAYNDDSQIVDLHTSKRYAESDYLVVTIRPMDAVPASCRRKPKAV